MQEIQETWVRSLDGDDPLEEEMATHSVFLPEKSHGQRSLAGYSAWGHKRVGHDFATTQQVLHPLHLLSRGSGILNTFLGSCIVEVSASCANG